MTEEIQIGDRVRVKTDNGVAESTVCFVVGQNSMIVLTNTHVDEDDIIEIRKGDVEAKRPFYDDIEGVKKREVQLYRERMEQFKTQHGQGSVGDGVCIAISVLEPVWTIDDIVEISGASRDTAERVVSKEQIRNIVEKVGEARTGGRPKSIYQTICGKK
jgi:hypothetical protein